MTTTQSRTYTYCPGCHTPNPGLTKAGMIRVHWLNKGRGKCPMGGGEASELVTVTR